VKKKESKGKALKRKKELQALKNGTEELLLRQIRYLLSLPMNKRTHFLRVRHPNRGSHL
jgi:hypothetical protein